MSLYNSREWTLAAYAEKRKKNKGIELLTKTYLSYGSDP